MRILLSYIGYPVGAGKFFKKALRNLGYKVVHFGPDADRTLPWMPNEDFSKYADRPDVKLPYPYEQTYPMDMALGEVEAKYGKVDLVIQMDANFHLVGKAPVPNVVWMIDNHVANYDASVENADAVFGAHSWGHHSGDKNFAWLPCAFSPTDHFLTPGAERVYDLLFMGVVYPHRAQMLNYLAPHGKVGMAMGILGKEYNDKYNQARMSLCMSACGDLPMRVFENAAQGCMIFCDKQPDLDKLGLKYGQHYISFDSYADAVEKFKLLIKEPERVGYIADMGRAALAKETYESRAETMISML